MKHLVQSCGQSNMRHGIVITVELSREMGYNFFFSLFCLLCVVLTS